MVNATLISQTKPRLFYSPHFLEMRSVEQTKPNKCRLCKHRPARSGTKNTNLEFCVKLFLLTSNQKALDVSHSICSCVYKTRAHILTF